jgi:hypothetical protein
MTDDEDQYREQPGIHVRSDQHEEWLETQRELLEQRINHIMERDDNIGQVTDSQFIRREDGHHELYLTLCVEGDAFTGEHDAE